VRFCNFAIILALRYTVTYNANRFCVVCNKLLLRTLRRGMKPLFFRPTVIGTSTSPSPAFSNRAPSQPCTIFQQPITICNVSHEDLQRESTELNRTHKIICNNKWRVYELRQLRVKYDVHTTSKIKHYYFIHQNGREHIKEKKYSNNKNSLN